MSRESRVLAERLQNLRGEREAEAVPVRELALSAVVRTKPVRVTADLSPSMYRALSKLAVEAAASLGRARLPQVEVIRALVRLASSETPLGQQIRTAVTEELSRAGSSAVR